METEGTDAVAVGTFLEGFVLKPRGPERSASKDVREITAKRSEAACERADYTHAVKQRFKMPYG